MIDYTLYTNIPDNEYRRLDEQELSVSSSVVSFTFPDMIDESDDTFTTYTASNLDNGYYTTSSVVGKNCFETSSNYYNINNGLKVTEETYLLSSGSADYWSWRKPSEIQVGHYLLGLNKEIRQVSSSEHIVSGTLGFCQINVEDVDTLFVDGYLIHNAEEPEGPGGEGGGGGSTPLKSFVFLATGSGATNSSASINLKLSTDQAPFPLVVAKVGANNSDNSGIFRLKAAMSIASNPTGNGDMDNIKLGLRRIGKDLRTFVDSTLSVPNYPHIEIEGGSGGSNNIDGGFSNFSGSGTTNRTITIELSSSAIPDQPTIVTQPGEDGVFKTELRFSGSGTSNDRFTLQVCKFRIADVHNGGTLEGGGVDLIGFDGGGAVTTSADLPGGSPGAYFNEATFKMARETLRKNSIGGFTTASAPPFNIEVTPAGDLSGSKGFPNYIRNRTEKSPLYVEQQQISAQELVSASIYEKDLRPFNS